MKIKDIKEYGFYQDAKDKKIIVEAFADDDNGKEVLSVMIWNWMKISDGINFYETDMFALNPENDDICDAEVIHIKTKFKIVDDNDKYYEQYGASSVMYEDKLSNTEKLEKIAILCLRESKALHITKDGIGDLVLEETGSAKFAKEILRIFEN